MTPADLSKFQERVKFACNKFKVVCAVVVVVPAEGKNTKLALFGHPELVAHIGKGLNLQAEALTAAPLTLAELNGMGLKPDGYLKPKTEGEAPTPSAN